jgi:hypothetical protein
VKDLMEEMRQERLRHPGRPKMTKELRAGMRGAMITMQGENPWIPGAVFFAAPGLQEWLTSALHDALTEDEG